MAPRGGLAASAHAPDLRAETSVSSGPGPASAGPRWGRARPRRIGSGPSGRIAPGLPPRSRPSAPSPSYRAAADGPPLRLHGAGGGRAAAAALYRAPGQRRANTEGAERAGRGAGRQRQPLRPRSARHRLAASPRAPLLGLLLPAPLRRGSGAGLELGRVPGAAGRFGALPARAESAGRCRDRSPLRTPGGYANGVATRADLPRQALRWRNAPSCFPVCSGDSPCSSPRTRGSGGPGLRNAGPAEAGGPRAQQVGAVEKLVPKVVFQLVLGCCYSGVKNIKKVKKLRTWPFLCPQQHGCHRAVESQSST